MQGSSPLAGKSIVLCVSGSVAAFKAVLLARLLVQAGARVTPVMTHAATRFVGPVTFSGICGQAVLEDMWDPRFSGELHVSLAAQADLVAIVPCTADLLARLAQGRADDLVSALALVTEQPLVAAPAMHPAMWAHPATVRNVEVLARDGRVQLIGPTDGPVASGASGLGRMAEPDVVFAAICARLALPRTDLAGKHVVVSAGPTFEDLDPARFLGNRSSGKMGFAIAEAAAERGAQVTLVAGPVARQTPPGVRRVDVRSALEMQAALGAALGPDLDLADVLVMAAAVADFRPTHPSASKTKKQPGQESMTLELTRNPDVLEGFGQRRGGRKAPVLVGFALETEALVANARLKRLQKRVDLIVANLAQDGFGGDDDAVVFVSASGERPLKGSKRQIADVILDLVLEPLHEEGPRT